jgi:hypothetical protein
MYEELTHVPTAKSFHLNRSAVTRLAWNSETTLGLNNDPDMANWNRARRSFDPCEIGTRCFPAVAE